jgi:hypothetical protein
MAMIKDLLTVLNATDLPTVQVNRFRQKTPMPRVLVYVVSSIPTKYKNSKAKLKYKRLQFFVEADTYEEAEALGQLLEDTIDGYKGDVGATRFHFISYDGENDEVIEDPEGNQKAYDYLVKYTKL